MLSAKPWKPEAVLFLFGGVYLCIVAGWLLTGALYPAAAKSNEITFGRAAVSILCFQGSALVIIGIFVRKHRLTWSEAFGFLNRWKNALLLGCAGAVLFMPVGWVLQNLSAAILKIFSQEPGEQAAVQALGTVQTWSEWFFMLATVIVLVPVVEEILFRGILYPLIKQTGFPKVALWGVSLFFAAMHFNAMIFLPLFALAMLLTLLYERTNNLLAPIAAHSLFNALNFALYYILQKYQ